MKQGVNGTRVQRALGPNSVDQHLNAASMQLPQRRPGVLRRRRLEKGAQDVLRPASSFLRIHARRRQHLPQVENADLRET